MPDFAHSSRLPQVSANTNTARLAGSESSPVKPSSQTSRDALKDSGVIFTTATYLQRPVRCLKQNHVFYISVNEDRPAIGEQIVHDTIAYVIVQVNLMATLWEIRTRRLC